MNTVTNVNNMRDNQERLCVWNYDLKLKENARLYPDVNSPERQEADRAVMMAEYRRLRAQEYEMTVLNETRKMDNLLRDGEAWNRTTTTFKNMNDETCTTTQGHSNYQLPRGYEGYASTSTARRAQVNDSAARWGRKFHLGDTTYYTCALSASCLVAQVSDKMNEGVPDGMGASSRSNLMTGKGNPNGTKCFYNIASIPADCKIGDNDKRTNRTVTDLIASGEMGVGDEFVVQSNNRSSGRHALFIAGVERDDSGRVVGYTLQAANKTRLIYSKVSYDKNGKPYGGDPNYGDKKVVGAVLTHKWMDKKLAAEEQFLQNMSLEELQAQVDTTRARVAGIYNNESHQFEGGLLTDLAQTEAYSVSRGYNTLDAWYAREETVLYAQNKEIDNANVGLLNAGQPDLMGRAAPIVLDASAEVPPAPETIIIRPQEPAQKPKKNIFQKAWGWTKGAVSDVKEWCSGAVSTVKRKLKKTKTSEVKADDVPQVVTNVEPAEVVVSAPSLDAYRQEVSVPEAPAAEVDEPQVPDPRDLDPTGTDIRDLWERYNGQDPQSVVTKDTKEGDVSEVMRNDRDVFEDLYALYTGYGWETELLTPEAWEEQRRKLEQAPAPEIAEQPRHSNQPPLSTDINLAMLRQNSRA